MQNIRQNRKKLIYCKIIPLNWINPNWKLSIEFDDCFFVASSSRIHYGRFIINTMHIYLLVAAYDGSITVISHGNRIENSISDFRLQSDRYVILYYTRIDKSISVGLNTVCEMRTLFIISFFIVAVVDDKILALTYKVIERKTLECLRINQNWISIAAMFMMLWFWHVLMAFVNLLVLIST